MNNKENKNIILFIVLFCIIYKSNVKVFLK